MDFLIIKRRETKHPYGILIFFLILFFTGGLYSQDTKPNKTIPAVKNETGGNTTVYKANTTANDSESSSVTMANMTNIEAVFERFVLNVDESIFAIFEKCRNGNSIYMDPFSCPLKPAFPVLWQALNEFFSQGNGCRWFYVFEKDNPLGGIRFSAMQLGDHKSDGAIFCRDNFFLANIEKKEFSRWIAQIANDNSTLKKGYILYIDEKVLVRPRQLLRTYTGKCIYIFSLDDSIYSCPDPPPMVEVQIPVKQEDGTLKMETGVTCCPQ